MLLCMDTMDKRFLLILTAIIVVFVGIFMFGKSDNSSSGNGSGKAQPSNHVVGANTKGVALVEYGDYQCPACAQYFPIVKEIKAKYGDQISFRFANFPLVQIHPNAMVSARAAEAAGMQGKFWEMHDLLYGNQSAWASSSNASAIFEQYAKDLGLDVSKFKQDAASSGVLDAINADTAEVQALGGDSTPTFVINGKKIENPTSLEGFTKAIDEAIKNANQ